MSTGTRAIPRSTGAGAISTVIVPVRGCRSLAAESGRPIVTVSRTVARAPAMLTGSVVASVTCCTADCGPITSTVAGSAMTRPATNPGAGSPSTSGTTGTVRSAENSNVKDTTEGVTCSTLTPVGTLMSSGSRWNRRLPARAALRSRTATRSAARNSPSRPLLPRTRTSTRLAGSPSISRCSGMLRYSSGMRSARSASRCPATSPHSRAASAIDRTLMPKFRKMLTRMAITGPTRPPREPAVRGAAEAAGAAARAGGRA